MKAAAVCCTLSLLIVLLAVTDARPGQSRWRREVTNTTDTETTNTQTSETFDGPADNGTCPTVPYCTDCIHNHVECVYCPSGMIQSSDYQSCLSCGSHCMKCHVSGTGSDGLDRTECDECQVSYALDSDKTCQYCGSALCVRCNISVDASDKVIIKHLECVPSAHLLSDECIGCPDYCETCTIEANADGTYAKTCSKCITGYGFQGSTTCSKCPTNCLVCQNEASKCDPKGCSDGYARSDTSGQCEACGQYCYKCQASAGPGKCDSGNCYTNVTELYLNVPHLYPVIYVSSTQTCEKCSEYCTSCSEPAKCDVCVKGYYRNDQNTCTRCIANCQECSSGTDCTACEEGYVKVTSSTGTVSCEACPRKCSQCADTAHPVKTTEKLCEVCSARHQLTTANTCDACPYNCRQCTWDGQCTSCEGGYAIYNGQCVQCPQYCTSCTVNNAGETECVTGKCTSTETGQGRVVYNGKCELCPDYCSECTVTVTGTKECLYSACQLNSVWVPGEKTCRQCPANCAGWCSISPITGETFCAECSAGYTEKDDGTCVACPANCDRCFWDGSQTLCSLTGCKSHYYQKLMNTAKSANTELYSTCSAIADNRCSFASPVPFFDSDAGLCELCDSGYVNTTSGCKSCTSNCQTCKADGAGVLCEACLPSSAPALDANGVITSCKSCSSVASGCQTCSTSACSACAAGHILHSESQCIACDVLTDATCSLSGNTLVGNTCPLGYTKTSLGCHKCPAGCKTCTYDSGTGATTCNNCFDGYFYDSTAKTCTPCTSASNCATCTSSVDTCASCKSKYYLDGTVCKACLSNCDACTAGDTCTACTPGSSYNADATNGNACLKCNVDNCVRCGSSSVATVDTCTSCEAGYVLDSGKCYSCPDGCKTCSYQSGQTVCNYGQCAFGYVMVAQANDKVTCESCGTGCAVCHADINRNIICDACMIDDNAGNSYYLANGACSQVTNCRQVDSTGKCDNDGCAARAARKGSYSTATCEACPADCEECYYDDAAAATKCNSNGCDSGFVSVSGACTACATNCLTCSTADSCDVGGCDAGYARVDTSGTITCEACATNCLTCSTAGSCDVGGCKAGFVRVDSSGTITCDACATNCLTCSTAGSCDVGGCKAGYGRKDTSGTITCEACPSNCLRCDVDQTICEQDQCALKYVRGSDNHCHEIACTASAVMDSSGSCQAAVGTCMVGDSPCPQGACKLGSVWENGACTACPTNCENCRNTDDGMVCHNNGCKRKYGRKPDGTCMACPSQCDECHYDGTKMVCDVCIDSNFELIPENTCLNCPSGCTACVENNQVLQCTQCEEGYVLNTDSNLCVQCVSNCKVCTFTLDTLSTQCTACKSKYKLSANKCTKCSTGCMKCDQTTDANSCDPMYCATGYVQGPTGACHSCPSECPDRCKYNETSSVGSGVTACFPTKEFYWNGNTLTPCPSGTDANCEKCQDSTNCLKTGCKDGYSWNQFKCDKKHEDNGAGDAFCVGYVCPACLDGYYMTTLDADVNQRVCKQCDDSNCAQCVDSSGSSRCTKCKSNYYLDVSSNCIACPVSLNCVECSLVGTDVKCTSCPANYYLHDTSGACIECFPSPCTQCDTSKDSTAKVCTGCAAGYFLNTTTHTCTACNTTCATCTDASKCVTCKSGYILDSTTKYCFKCPDVNAYNCELKNGYDSLILTDGCNTGYAVSADRKSCLKCPNYCTTCNSNLTCSACETGYSLNSDQCGRCPLNCQSCSPKLDSEKRLSLQCDVCDAAYALHSDGLCYACPPHCATCTAKDSGTATPTLTCTECTSNQYGLKDGLCEECYKLTIENCYTCEPVSLSDNSTSTTATASYTCHSCKDNNVLSLDNQTCLSCSSLSCGMGGRCDAYSLCQSCQSSFSIEQNRHCTVKCYSCEKGSSCRHIDDKWDDRSGMTTVTCNGPCFFYTQYPINGGESSKISWYGCADENFTVLNYEATYNDKMKALECKGKAGQPETCVYTCAYDECNPGDFAAAVAPLLPLLLVAILSSLMTQEN